MLSSLTSLVYRATCFASVFGSTVYVWNKQKVHINPRVLLQLLESLPKYLFGHFRPLQEAYLLLFRYRNHFRAGFPTKIFFQNPETFPSNDQFPLQNNKTLY